METINLLESDNPFALAVLVGRIAFVGHKIRDNDERVSKSIVKPAESSVKAVLPM